MSYSPAWQAARDARRARRAADPQVQARARDRQQQAAREQAKHARPDEAVEALRARQLEAVDAA